MPSVVRVVDVSTEADHDVHDAAGVEVDGHWTERFLAHQHRRQSGCDPAVTAGAAIRLTEPVGARACLDLIAFGTGDRDAGRAAGSGLGHVNRSVGSLGQLVGGIQSRRQTSGVRSRRGRQPHNGITDTANAIATIARVTRRRTFITTSQSSFAAAGTLTTRSLACAPACIPHA